jgi:hypothetical protein
VLIAKLEKLEQRARNTENAFDALSDAEFLRYVAQNDYMIDQHYLPTGARLLAIAAEMELEELHAK